MLMWPTTVICLMQTVMVQRLNQMVSVIIFLCNLCCVLVVLEMLSHLSHQVSFKPFCPCTRPLWLSPRQVMLVPVNPSCEDYAKRVSLQLPHLGCIQNCRIQMVRRLIHGISIRQVCKQFTEAGFMAEADLDSSCLLNKKIRNAQLAQYNFILGKKTVNTDSPLVWRALSPPCPPVFLQLLKKYRYTEVVNFVTVNHQNEDTRLGLQHVAASLKEHTTRKHKKTAFIPHALTLLSRDYAYFILMSIVFRIFTIVGNIVCNL